MKKSIFILLCAACIACAEKKESEDQDYSNLTFSLDTVMVDPGEEILHLKDNLFLSSLTQDGKYLYNFDRNNAVMEKIDLDGLSLLKKIQFEKEGPNGIGNFISNFSVTQEGNIMIWFYGLSAIFDEHAKMVKNLNFDQIAGKEINGSEAYPIAIFEFPKDQNRYLGLYLHWGEKHYFLLDVDTENESYQKTDLPEMDRIFESAIGLMYEGQWVGSFGHGSSSMFNKEKIIIGNTVFNQSYVFDTLLDTLYLKSWDGPLIGSKKTYIGPKQVDYQSGEHWEADKKVKEDINFGNMVWNPAQQQYYRFSTKEKFGEEKEEHGAYKATGADVFLSIFDKDLNLIAESLVPALNKNPSKHFVKDGKIWIFENIEDELGFVRLSFQ